MSINFLARRISIALLVIVVGWMTGQAWSQNGSESPSSALQNAGSEITYQGTLQSGGAPAEGRHDFVFRLWDAPTRGSVVGQPLTVTNVNVVAGQFTVQLDFGARVYNGQALYLEIDVKSSTESVYETLAPRQPLSGVPLAHSVRPGMTVANSESNTGATIAGGTAGVAGTGGTYGGAFSGDSGVFAEGTLTDLVLSGSGFFPGVGNISSDPGISNSHLIFTSNAGISLALDNNDDAGDGVLSVLNGGETVMSVADSELFVHDANGVARASLTATSERGSLYLRNPSNFIGFAAQGAETGGGGGIFRLFNSTGVPTVMIDGQQAGGSGGEIVVEDGEGEVAARLYNDPFEGGGQLELGDGTGEVTLVLEGAEAAGDGAMIIMRNISDSNTIVLDADGSDLNGASLQMRDWTGNMGALLQVDDAGSNGGVLRLYDGSGTNTISLSADYNDTGTGRITTPVLEITGGADLSEQFDVQAAPGDPAAPPAPGMVVCIDAMVPGQLVICSKPYDATVAGIISGAGGVDVGLLMGQDHSLADGAYPVALSGRVYVWAQAADEPIEPGDLLTTAGRAGYAMRAADAERAFGAILGKAMTGLEPGESGLVLVLVSLQ